MSLRFDGWTLRQEYVWCGRSCCGRCPHGPYWYGYRRESGRMKKRYFGKRRPTHPDFRVPESATEEPHRDDAILSGRTASAEVACRILGLSGLSGGRPSLHEAYRAAILRVHPDRGGDIREYKRVNAALEYLRDVMG